MEDYGSHVKGIQEPTWRGSHWPKMGSLRIIVVIDQNIWSISKFILNSNDTRETTVGSHPWRILGITSLLW